MSLNFIRFVLHFGLGFAVLGAAVWNSRVLRSLMHIRAATFWGPIVFGLGTVAAQAAQALGSPGTGFDLAVDLIRLVAALAFIVGLFVDSRRIVVRLAAAMDAIGAEFDDLPVVPGARGQQLIESGEAERLRCAPVVLATIDFALHGATDEPPRPPARGRQ